MYINYKLDYCSSRAIFSILTLQVNNVSEVAQHELINFTYVLYLVFNSLIVPTFCYAYLFGSINIIRRIYILLLLLASKIHPVKDQIALKENIQLLHSMSNGY